MNFSSLPTLGCCAFGLLIAAQACSPAAIGEGIRPEAPTGAQALEPGESAVCRPDAPISMLSVDLPSSVRVALESGMKQGVVVVAHDCKHLRVLESCQLPGDYTFAGVTRKEDVVTLRDLTELQANLPLGAVQLATQIASGTSIHLALVQVGTRRTLFNEVGRGELRGVCDGATHFLRGTVMGAFALSTSERGDVQAAAEVFGYQAAGRSTSDRDLRQKDGSLDACRASHPNAMEPPAECGVPVRLQLVPISAKTPDRRETKESAGSEKMESKPLESDCPRGLRRSGAVCTRSVGICAPEDEGDCQKQCDGGDPGSCYNLAELLRDRLHEEASKASKEAGPKDSWEKIEARYNEARGKYRPYYVKACDGGIALSCDRLYYIKGPDQERRHAIEKACELGNGASCSMAAARFLYHAETRDMAKGRELLDRGCRLGSRGACMGLVDTYFQPPDGTQPSQEDSRAGEAILERMCQANDPYRCADLARRRAKGDGLTKDIALSLAYLDRACALNDPTSCYELGATWLAGNGVGRDPTRAQGYFERACPVEKPEGLDACTSVARLYRGTKPIVKDPAQALVWLGRGCRYGQQSACLDLAEMYERGEGTPRNDDRAVELYEAGCAAGAPSGCVGQIRVLKTKDPKRALELSRRGCKQNHAEFCGFVVEIAKKDAAEIFEADCTAQTSMACLELGRQLERTAPARALEVFRKLCPDGSGPTYACDAVGRAGK
jgi:hypothetical protein